MRTTKLFNNTIVLSHVQAIGELLINNNRMVLYILFSGQWIKFDKVIYEDDYLHEKDFKKVLAFEITQLRTIITILKAALSN